MKLTTPAAGAAAERQAITRAIKRHPEWELADVLLFIKGRTARYQKKPGGLGRKKSSATRSY